MGYKYDKNFIQYIAGEIMMGLSKHNLSGDTCIYFNGKRYSGNYDNEWKEDELDDGQPYHGQDYCEYAGKDQIINLSTEGSLYDYLYNRGTPEWLDSLLEKNGLYMECCENWFYAIVPMGDWEDWEVYTNPNAPKEQIFIYSDETCPDDLIMSIRNVWKNLIASGTDVGSCVIAAGMEFEYNNNRYFMSPPSCYQGSMSWEKYVHVIKELLKEAGAEKVYYNPGRLD